MEEMIKNIPDIKDTKQTTIDPNILVNNRSYLHSVEEIDQVLFRLDSS